MVMATARRGRTAEELQQTIDEEIDRLRREPPDAREVQRAINQVEASFYRRMERVGGFGGGVDNDQRMFDKVMKPVIQQLVASLKAADI